jgi:cobalt-zinc-cadmium efflux system protein
MWEAVGRLFSPPKIISWLMIGVAVFGALGNLLQNWVLAHATAAEEAQVTHEAAHLHVLSDLWQTVAVIAAGIIIAATGWRIIDPILSIVISLVMVYWSIRLFRRSHAEYKANNPH